MPVLVRSFSDIAPVPCPCGESQRAITRADTDIASIHLTHITDAELHYHKETTEFYYIVEGSGRMVVGDEEFGLEPGVVFMVEKDVNHRGWGDFKALIVATPAIQAGDEYMVEE